MPVKDLSTVDVEPCFTFIVKTSKPSDDPLDGKTYMGYKYLLFGKRYDGEWEIMQYGKPLICTDKIEANDPVIGVARNDALENVVDTINRYRRERRIPLCKDRLTMKWIPWLLRKHIPYGIRGQYRRYAAIEPAVLA